MKPAFLADYARSRRKLDLDDSVMSMEKLEVFAPESGRKTPQSMAVLFLQLVLRQALTDRAVAVNLFHDAEDDCLRGLEYFAEQDEGAEIAWREFCPAPGCFAEQVLNELRWRIGMDQPSGHGILHYRYHGSGCQASAFGPSSREIRLYFTDDRPPMQTKDVTQPR